MLSYPLVYVPFWNRSWRQAIIPVVAWFALNPWLFPPPGDTSSWMTRGVRGEQRWTRSRPIDFSLLLNVVLAPCFAAALNTAYARRLRELIFFATVAFLLKLWFVHRMTMHYASHGASAV